MTRITPPSSVKVFDEEEEEEEEKVEVEEGGREGKRGLLLSRGWLEGAAAVVVAVVEEVEGEEGG